MSRRQLDFVFAGGGLVLALLLLVLGFVLADQASFAKSYVKDELGSQKITFATVDKLTDEEKNWKPGSACLTENAGKLMETGKQAECYANFFIGLHLENSANNAGFPGETYATLGGIRTQLTADVAAAKAKNDTEGAAAAQKKLDSATSLRSTMQTGETLRGLLLTSYGFSIFGGKAGQVSWVAFSIAGLLVLLAAAGFVHAFRTAPDKLVGVPAGYKLTPTASGPDAPSTST
jgi:hypothetical protein